MLFHELALLRTSTRTFDSIPVPREMIDKILETAQTAPSSCNLQLTQCIIVDDKNLLTELTKKADKKFSWAPCILVFVFDKRINRKRWASQISLGCLVENCLLSATEYGLASCPIAGFGSDSTVKQILKIPKYMEIGLLVALGYANERTVRQKERLSLQSFAHRNKYDKQSSLKTVSLNLKQWTVTDIINYRERIAPVYLYKQHNRLSSFAPQIIEHCFKIFLNHFNEDIHEKRNYLDICTYDGLFLKKVHESIPHWSLLFSDHLRYIGKIHEDSYNKTKFIPINYNNTFNIPTATIDNASCVHKLEFAPERELLIKEISRTLKKDGKLFISIIKPGLLRLVYNRAVIILQRLINNPNVYDGNIYYKIGPIDYISMNRLIKMCKKYGLNCLRSGTEKLTPPNTKKHEFNWLIFEKNN